MDRLPKDMCTGCGACFNACPNNAISMKGDKHGFYKPIISQDKCIDCGVCEKVCPLDRYASKNMESPKTYAFQNKDEKTLYKCASGGAFALFGKNVIENKGIVYGVIFDENFIVCHSRADNLNDLEKMYNSKYTQSNTRNMFKLAKIDLENGKFVLFTGTPCQIGGLKSYLRKEYENLVTVDLVCHGVPAPIVFEKYKKELTEKFAEKEKLLNINFRSKMENWSLELTTTTTTTKTINTFAKHDDFMRAFLHNLCLNNSCLNCQFSRLPRTADITIGDFWGVDEYDKSLNNEKGLSIVLVNNEAGQNFIQKLPKEHFLAEIPLEAATKRNRNLYTSSKAHKNRIRFMQDIIKKDITLKKCLQKYDRTPLYIRFYHLLPQFIKNFIKYNILKKERDSV